MRRHITDIFLIRALTVMLTVLMLAGTLAGCGGSGSAGGTGGSGGAGSPGAQSGKTITVTDCTGREVEVPEQCDRIAALDSFTAEAMVIAGAGERICACPNGTKSDVLLQQLCPTLKDAPSVKINGSINVEGLISLGADVVIVKSAILQNEDEIGKLEKLNIPYVAIEYATMEEQIAAMELIGTICGGSAQEKMTQVADYYRSTVKTVKEHAAKIPYKEKVKVYHSINEAVRTDGKNSLGAEWIEAVGGIDVSAGEMANVDGVDYQATLEQIYAWDPDVIICNSAESVDYLNSDSKWKGMRAVRDGQVKAIPVGTGRWGHRGSVETYFAMLWLGCTIYPEYYKDVDLKKEVTTYYNDILGIEVDDELYEEMLSGKGMRRLRKSGEHGE